MKKTISVILITLMIVLGTLLPAYAALPEDNTIQPLWDNISSMTSNFGFDGTDGSAAAACVRKTGVSLLEGTLKVYENVNGNWVYVTEVSKSATFGTLAMSVHFTCKGGTQYRSDFTVTAYKNGVAETATKTTYQTCP